MFLSKYTAFECINLLQIACISMIALFDVYFVKDLFFIFFDHHLAAFLHILKEINLQKTHVRIRI